MRGYFLKVISRSSRTRLAGWRGYTSSRAFLAAHGLPSARKRRTGGAYLVSRVVGKERSQCFDAPDHRPDPASISDLASCCAHSDVHRLDSQEQDRRLSTLHAPDANKCSLYAMQRGTRIFASDRLLPTQSSPPKDGKGKLIRQAWCSPLRTGIEVPSAKSPTMHLAPLWKVLRI